MYIDIWSWILFFYFLIYKGKALLLLYYMTPFFTFFFFWCSTLDKEERFSFEIFSPPIISSYVLWKGITLTNWLELRQPPHKGAHLTSLASDLTQFAQLSFALLRWHLDMEVCGWQKIILRQNKKFKENLNSCLVSLLQFDMGYKC